MPDKTLTEASLSSVPPSRWSLDRPSWCCFWTPMVSALGCQCPCLTAGLHTSLTWDGLAIPFGVYSISSSTSGRSITAHLLVPPALSSGPPWCWWAHMIGHWFFYHLPSSPLSLSLGRNGLSPLLAHSCSGFHRNIVRTPSVYSSFCFTAKVSLPRGGWVLPSFRCVGWFHGQAKLCCIAFNSRYYCVASEFSLVVFLPSQ